MTSKRKRATALRYEQTGAPRVVAGGAGKTAERILEIARAAGVPVREDPALAEALSRLPLEHEIPEELYVAIAEVLVWAYALDSQR